MRESRQPAQRTTEGQKIEPDFGQLPGEMSAVDVAAQLGVHLSTLVRWRSSDCGPKYIRRGGRVIYREADIAAYRRDGDKRKAEPTKRKRTSCNKSRDELPRIPAPPPSRRA